MAEQCALSRPPEGVIRGESIPRENEHSDYERLAQERTIALLKTMGKPYTEMREYELAEIARRLRGSY